MVIVDADKVKLCLNDKDNDRSAWVSGDTLEGALKSLDIGLASGLIPWRANKPYEPPPKRKSR
jgi:hypothetical protein